MLYMYVIYSILHIKQNISVWKSIVQLHGLQDPTVRVEAGKKSSLFLSLVLRATESVKLTLKLATLAVKILAAKSLYAELQSHESSGRNQVEKYFKSTQQFQYTEVPCSSCTNAVNTVPLGCSLGNQPTHFRVRISLCQVHLT